MTKAIAFVQSRMNREEGQALVEYALILGLIAIVSIVVLATLGTNVSSILDRIGQSLTNLAP